ncbi:B12-binding domain-containing radical SAM protein [Phenylobacterium sp. VNQ135]|uniref:B12-binding domain-containing radical SAM protein n=1 Tax=Phenylobacterium sp. VNQ135 TaxID=3400922 RepID=UPI003C006EE3
MKVLLINTGNDPGIGGNANENAYPPLGVISLATALVSEFKQDIDVEVIDCQVVTAASAVDVIIRKRPDLVGLSMYSTSIKNTIQMAQVAASVGARVIVGNDHASMHASLLLSKVPSIEFICTNDVGEETILALVSHLRGERSLEDVPLLAFRGANGEIHQTKSSRYAPGSSLDDLPVPMRTLLGVEYWDEYARRFHLQERRYWDFEPETRVSTINRARGCAQMANPCRYCGIADLSIRYSTAPCFWADVRAARQDVGATVLYEAFDSASSAPAVLRSWLKGRPDDLSDTAFKMYAQAFECDSARVELFKRLNVFCLNMGLDSGDDHVLKLLKGDRHSLQGSKEACLRIADAGIEVYTSFVLLGLGDADTTRRSLDKTVEFAEWLIDNSSVVSFDSALMYPDKAAPIGRLIWHPEEAASTARDLGWDFLNLERLKIVSDRWRSEVYLDPLELCSDFASVCGVDGAMLMEYAAILEQMAKKASLNFGRSQGGPQ